MPFQAPGTTCEPGVLIPRSETGVGRRQLEGVDAATQTPTGSARLAGVERAAYRSLLLLSVRRRVYATGDCAGNCNRCPGPPGALELWLSATLVEGIHRACIVLPSVLVRLIRLCHLTRALEQEAPTEVMGFEPEPCLTGRGRSGRSGDCSRLLRICPTWWHVLR